MIESEWGCECPLITFDNIDEARKFCDEFDWVFVDENEFHWEMSIETNW
jgi:hypothetical protein